MPLDRRRADLVQQQVGERVRQVADEREQPVVRVRVDRDRDGAERADERVQRRGSASLSVAACGARNHVAPSKRSARAPSGPAHLGAGDGMAADEALVGDRARERRPSSSRRPSPSRPAPRRARPRRRSSSIVDLHGDDDELGGRGRRLGGLGAASTAPRSAAVGERSRRPCPSRARRARPAARRAPTDAPISPVPMTATRIPRSFAATLRSMSPAPRSEPWSWRSERGGSLARLTRPLAPLASRPFTTLESRPCASSAASNPQERSTSATTAAASASTRRRRRRATRFFCIVDLHSITVDYDPEDLRDARRSTSRRCCSRPGSTPSARRSSPRATSTAHPEAAWLLSAVTSYGQLGRMTQFKEKGERQEFVSAGLFTYPVLMAGDILLYQTDLVPIGDDQRQHLELARDVARAVQLTLRRDVHACPKGATPSSARGSWTCRSRRARCRRPAAPSRGRCSSLDPPDVIRKKFKSAVTDSGREVRHDRDEKPGVSNLIEIMSVATGEPIAEIESRYDGAGYGQFKEDVGEAVVALLDPIRRAVRRAACGRARAAAAAGDGRGEGAEGVGSDARADVRRMGFVMPQNGRHFGAARPRGLYDMSRVLNSGHVLSCVAPSSGLETFDFAARELTPRARLEPSADSPRTRCDAGDAPDGRPPRASASPGACAPRGSSARPVTAEQPRPRRRRRAVLELDASPERAQRVVGRRALRRPRRTSSRRRSADARAGARARRRSSAAARPSCPRRAARPARRAPAGRRARRPSAARCGSLAVVTTPARLVQQHVGQPLLRDHGLPVDLDAVARGDERVQLTRLAVDASRAPP